MSYVGSGFLSKNLNRTICCDSCDLEWQEDMFFDDLGVCDERYSCPKCHEYVYYYEDLREKQWEE